MSDKDSPKAVIRDLANYWREAGIQEVSPAAERRINDLIKAEPSEKCPACGGSGMLKNGGYPTNDPELMNYYCPVCGGTGIAKAELIVEPCGHKFQDCNCIAKTRELNKTTTVVVNGVTYPPGAVEALDSIIAKATSEEAAEPNKKPDLQANDTTFDYYWLNGRLIEVQAGNNAERHRMLKEIWAAHRRDIVRERRDEATSILGDFLDHKNKHGGGGMAILKGVINRHLAALKSEPPEGGGE